MFSYSNAQAEPERTIGLDNRASGGYDKGTFINTSSVQPINSLSAITRIFSNHYTCVESALSYKQPTTELAGCSHTVFAQDKERVPLHRDREDPKHWHKNEC